MFEARFTGNTTAFQAGIKFPPGEWVDVDDDSLFLMFVKMGKFDVQKDDGTAHFVQKTHESGDVYEQRILQLEYDKRKLTIRCQELEAGSDQPDSGAEDRARRAEIDADSLRIKVENLQAKNADLRAQVEELLYNKPENEPDKAQLVQEAKSLDVKVDGRWSASRLQQEIDKALAE